MPVLIPHHSVVIHRDGKNVRPPIGVPFDFTTIEAKDLLAAHSTCLRRPIREAPPVVELPEVTSEELATEEDEDDPAPVALTPAQRKAADRRATARAIAADKAAAAAEEDDDAL